MEFNCLIDQTRGNHFRKLLKDKGYFDGQRKVIRIPNYVLVPVKPSFVCKYIDTSMQRNIQNSEETLEKTRRDFTDMLEKEHIYEDIPFKFQIIKQDTVKKKKIVAPRDILLHNLRNLCDLHHVIWNFELEKDVAQKWEKHGDLILLPHRSFCRPEWEQLGPELWLTVADCLGATRVARKHVIAADDFRSPQVQMLLGENGWVEHKDNGIRYRYNIETNMFSAGNVTEKLRVSSFRCHGETVVDLFAGIGYFTLPYLVHAGVSHMHACEWNPHAVAALKHNLQLNGVEQRCTVYAGDNREVCPKGVADRVNLGLIPSSEQSWSTACAALKPQTGGILHIHANVTSSKDVNKAQVMAASHKSVSESKPNAYEEKNPIVTFPEEAKSDCCELVCHNRDVNDEFDDNCDAKKELTSNDTSHISKKMDDSMRLNASTDETTDDIKSSHKVKYEKRAKFSKSKIAKQEWIEYAMNSGKQIKAMLEDIHDNTWITELLHIEHVKSYAPHVDHIVIDLKCFPQLE